MRTVRLPLRPGVAVTQLGFGGAPIGNLYEDIPDDQAKSTVDTAWDNGIRYIDTAPHYGAGLSEARVGAALAGNQWTISTKVGRLLKWTPGGVVRVFDYSADGVRRSLEQSLRRLRIDRLDIVFVHDPDDHWDQARDEAIPALCALRDQGVIGAVGAGMNQSAMLARFVAETDVDVVMCAGRYTLLDQPALADLLPLAVARRVAVLAAGVFNSGLLAHAEPKDRAKYDYAPVPPDVLLRAKELAEVCREHGTSLPVAAVHFPMRHPAVVGVVLGMSSPAEVRQNTGFLATPPPPTLWADLAARGLLAG
ncbi:aldo/keto reductase [Actinocrispum sp. NPDC049592]|uniref:aldo/keto reductase n=1 Tax=Actinocrispum sp. NPDC049592 TaxID=3154835 RepID=UPI003436F6BD